MAGTDQRPVRLGARTPTWIAGILVTGAAMLLAWALSGNGGIELPVTTQTSQALNVGRAGCDDTRSAAVVRDPATPWCSLRRALQAAPAGADVVLGPGRYDALELDGRRDDYQPVRFRAQEGNRPVLNGVRLNSVRDVSFSGLAFAAGLEIANSTGMRIEHNQFAGGGITIKSSRDVRIAGNTIRQLRGTVRGLIAQGSSDPGQAGNVDLSITGNRFRDIEHDAIAVYNSHSRVRIIGNRISHVREPEGFALHTDAVQLMGGEDVTVRDNVISDVTHGILIKDGVPSTGLKVQRNLITDSPGAGLQIFNAPGALVVRNTVWDTAFGTILDDLPGIRADRVTLLGNVFDQLLVNAPGAVDRAEDNVFGRGRLVGLRASNDRPEFLDERAGDFRVRRQDDDRLLGAQKRVR